MVAHQNAASFFNKRIYLLCLLTVLALFIIGGRLFYLQVIKGFSFSELSKNNRIRKIRLVPPRGFIFDRQGRLLVDNRPSYDAVAEIEDIKLTPDFYKIVAPILDISEEKLKKQVRSLLHSPYVPVVLRKDMDMAMLTRVEEIQNLVPALKVQISPVREYLIKGAASHVLGYVGKINEKEWERLDPLLYDKEDWIGKSGIEDLVNDSLHGIPGGMQVEVDFKGFLNKVLSQKDPVAGHDIYLTIDQDLQGIVRGTLADWRGAVVVMNVNSGEILAMVSAPDFDPNIFLSSKNSYAVSKIMQDQESVLLNRALAGLYPPGSPFKLIVALAALEEGIIQKDTAFFCGGYFELGSGKFACWKKDGHATVDVTKAIQYSCNVFFYHVGLKLGREKIVEWSRRFGLGEKTSDDLWSEKNGSLPNNEWLEKKNIKWNQGDTVNISIGQGYLVVTPIQLVRMIATIATRGRLVTPHLIQSDKKYPEKHVSVTQETWDIIQHAMFEVIHGVDGTGALANTSEVAVAGKTGTVQTRSKDKQRLLTWFTGYAPYENPEIALAMVLEGGVSGGKSAAPLAKKIFEFYFKDHNTKVQHDLART